MLKRRSSIEPVEFYAHREKRFYECQKIKDERVRREIREFLDNYYITYNQYSEIMRQDPERYPDGRLFGLISSYVTEPAARQYLINTLELFILPHVMEPFQLLVSHLDWPPIPAGWAGLYAFHPPARKPLPCEALIDKLLSSSECI